MKDFLTVAAITLVVATIVGFLLWLFLISFVLILPVFVLIVTPYVIVNAILRLLRRKKYGQAKIKYNKKRI